MLAPTSTGSAAPLVLIVDDDRDSCEMYSTCMRSSGLRVGLAHDGLEGFDLAVSAAPDLLVTDIVMPGIDGFELSRRLRETELLRGIPVIAVTARPVTQEDVDRLQTGGIASVLIKPCEPIRLLSEVWRLLNQSKGIREKSMAIRHRAARAKALAAEACGESVAQRERWLTLVSSHRIRDAERIRGDYMDMPGLALTVSDAARLWNLSEDGCENLMMSLVDEGFLVYRNGRFLKPGRD
jgi:CheY-like chemotaxis protein